MSSEHHYDVVPQNFNNFSHKELSHYVKSVLDLYISQPLEDSHREMKFGLLVGNDIWEYEVFIAQCFITNSDSCIDELEKERYRAFEVFIDAIDDIQHIEIDDPYGVLYTVNIDCDEARYLLPEYLASHKLLIPSQDDENWGEFYSPGARLGHNWPVNAIDACIEHLRDTRLREYLEITNLTGAAQKLIQANYNVLAALNNNDVTITFEQLKKLRQFRGKIIDWIEFLYLFIPQCSCKLKDKTVYDAHIIFRDRLIAKEEIDVLSTPSHNDLSHSQLLQLAKVFEKTTDEKSNLYGNLSTLLKNQISLFQHTLEAFASSIFWTQFQEYERKLLSTLDLLLSSLALNFRCIVGEEHKQLWDEHYESECFDTVDEFLEDFDDETYNNIAGFTRGSHISYSLLKIVLASWKNPDYRKYFDKIHCNALLDDCLLYYETVAELGNKIVYDNQNLSISDLRDQRMLLTNILSVVDFYPEKTERIKAK